MVWIVRPDEDGTIWQLFVYGQIEGWKLQLVHPLDGSYELIKQLDDKKIRKNDNNFWFRFDKRNLHRMSMLIILGKSYYTISSGQDKYLAYIFHGCITRMYIILLKYEHSFEPCRHNSPKATFSN